MSRFFIPIHAYKFRYGASDGCCTNPLQYIHQQMITKEFLSAEEKARSVRGLPPFFPSNGKITFSEAVVPFLFSSWISGAVIGALTGGIITFSKCWMYNRRLTNSLLKSPLKVSPSLPKLPVSAMFHESFRKGTEIGVKCGNFTMVASVLARTMGLMLGKMIRGVISGTMSSSIMRKQRSTIEISETSSSDQSAELPAKVIVTEVKPEQQKSSAPVGKIIGAIAGIIAAITCWCIPMDPDNKEVQYCAGCVLLIAIFWMFEVLPLAVTAFLPLVLFPVFSLQEAKTVAGNYMKDTSFVFLGGFVMALAMQRWNLHTRLSLKVVVATGGRPKLLLFGMMAITWFLSMWISNTATVMAMMPNVLAISDSLEKSLGKDKVRKFSLGMLLGVAYSASIGGVVMAMMPNVLAISDSLEKSLGKDKVRKFSLGMLLGVAYSASIGGVGTLIGTPPNLFFRNILAETYIDTDTGKGVSVSFSEWFFFAFPTALVLFLIVYVLFIFAFVPGKKNPMNIDMSDLKNKLALMGKASFEEKMVGVSFIILAFLWMFRKDLDFGSFKIPGWSSIYPDDKNFISDGTVAMFVSIMMFVIPAKNPDPETGDKTHIMEWKEMKKVPWDILFLFGGGFAISDCFSSSGLNVFIGDKFSGLDGVSPGVIIFVSIFVITFLTEVTSNTATSTVFLPVFAALANTLNQDPRAFMIPVAVACSFAFALPVATPCNLIVFGSKKITMGDMAKTGIVINFIAIALSTVLCIYYLPRIFGFTLGDPAPSNWSYVEASE
ncbi:sodium-dependent high-affinity dicarboxylate transporter, putative [Aduncisulcus paluster]|uniref:Sodium-dependent high-affinity dicarboxylate transporter, putative n=1 Tax=Aduncisulcus paluster TaxID=2918883 RepID=A0ABQ5JZ70_9EUKA|nr:sodium-dependent high-affinity dicarboxylate transporter, putative [Aduncisulcus paluster]